MIAIPILALLVGAKVAVVGTTIVGPLLTASILVRDWDQIRRRTAFTVTLAAVVGMPLGIFVLSHASDRALTAIIGIIVVTAGLALWRGLQVPSGRFAEPLAGLVSGAFATSTGTSGPPLVIVFHSESLEPKEFRGTLAATFLAQSVVALFAFWASGHLTVGAAYVALAALPGLAVGWLVGERLFEGMSKDRFRALVLVVLIASGAVSVVGALVA